MNATLEFLKTNWKWASSVFCLLVGTGIMIFSDQPELGWAFLIASGLPFTAPGAYKKGPTIKESKEGGDAK